MNRSEAEHILNSDVTDYPPLRDEARRVLSGADHRVPCYVFDIDGTLADIKHRLHFVKGKHLDGGEHKPDYDAFIDASVHDEPIAPVVQTARNLSQHAPIILITGRREAWRVETTDWLRRHGVPFAELHMRPTDDDRPDFEVKRDLYRQRVAERYHTVAVFDDRDRVVNMWRELGIPCFQVAAGAY